MCTGAVAMTDALNQFGFLEFTNGVIGGLGMGSAGLPFLAAGATVVGTNLFSGTAAATLFCSIFIPTAQEVGFNPASMAILIPNVAVGILFPWAGASAGTAFASGFLDMREMIKVGVVASRGSGGLASDLRDHAPASSAFRSDTLAATCAGSCLRAVVTS
jgi:di/tricarboxylate transporter